MNMIYLRKIPIFIIISMGNFLSCQWSPEPRIQETIQPIVLFAGKPDTILVSDIFYAEDYLLFFKPNPNVAADYYPKSKKLYLTPKPEFEGFTLLEFSLKGQKYHIPIYSRIKQKHLFEFRPESRPLDRMNIMGTFNDWNRSSLPMQDEDLDGIYEIELELDPGQYLYQYVVDQAEIWDPENPEKVDNGFGSFNSVISIPPRHKEKAFLHVMGYERWPAQTILKFLYEKENSTEPLTNENIFGLIDNLALNENQVNISGNQIEIKLNSEDSNNAKAVRLLVAQNGQSTNMQTIHLQDGRPAGDMENKFGWHDASIYAIMIDRFFDGDTSNSRTVPHDSLSLKANYMGGDLKGIIDKMEEGYFDSLGINALWLSPVNQSTNTAFKEWPAPHRYYSAYHGYWPTHHEKVEERFGDLQLLKSLVVKAHERGIKILLDFTANHVHIEHPFFQEHRDWFGTLDLPDGRKNIRLWDEFRLTTWFEPFLPSFDYSGSEAALEAMTDNAIWWLRETQIDGFRQDAVKHVPNKFWRVLTKKIKREIEKPENRKVYQIGETFGSYKLISSYVNNGQLNAQFNFNLYDTGLYVFLNPDANFSILAKELQKTFSVFGLNHLMGNVMDSHDKVRFMAYADGDISFNSSEAQEIGWRNPPKVTYASSYAKAKLYMAYIMTIPGLPILNYGDEIGMTGAADPDNRRMMRFDDEITNIEKIMLNDTRQIVQMRRRHSALRYGDFQTLLANENCFVYLRSDMHERILVALNKSMHPQTIEVEVPAFYRVNNVINIINNQELALSENKLSLTISPLGWNVLKIE